MRQAAIRRQDTLTTDDLFDVMRIPETLQDHQRVAEVRQVFKVVCGDPILALGSGENITYVMSLLCLKI